MDDTIENLFERLTTESNPIDFLSEFIFPHLVGDEWINIRKAVLLILSTHNDSMERMRLHMLLYGGAGLGKTVAMSWIHENLGGIMVNADLTSKVGLVGDARGGAINPGLLSDYDGNIVLLDELDKMNTADQSGLLQAMEEGQYTIVKGGDRRTFQSEVRVIASANEIKKISRPLLDRFDFIFRVKTLPREKRAEGVERIVNSFFNGDKKVGVNLLNAYLEWIGDFEPMVEESNINSIVNMMRKYILLTKTAIEDISYRSLELSILRIAYAMAKLQKSNITPSHIEEAIIFKDKMLRDRVGINE